MYIEIFNRDLFGAEKPIVVESNEYGIKDKYLLARNFIINTFFDGKVNIDRIIVIKINNNNLEKIEKGDNLLTYDFTFLIDKFTHGRFILRGFISIHKSGLITYYQLDATSMPTSFYECDSNKFNYSLNLGKPGESLNITADLNSLHADVDEDSSKLMINDPSIVASVLDDVKRINNPKE